MSDEEEYSSEEEMDEAQRAAEEEKKKIRDRPQEGRGAEAPRGRLSGQEGQEEVMTLRGRRSSGYLLRKKALRS